jgi:hypothetical protein
MAVIIRKPRKIVTFLGAGTSAPFDHPTTQPLLERLGREVSNDQLALLNTLRNLQ